MKKTGKCPKCESEKIYTDCGQMKRGERCSVAISSWKQLILDTYLCTECGYIEEYVRAEDLKDETKSKKIVESWQKHFAK